MIKALLFSAFVAGLSWGSFFSGKYIQRLEDQRAAELLKPARLDIGVGYSDGNRATLYFDMITAGGTTNWHREFTAQMIDQGKFPEGLRFEQRKGATSL